MTKSVAVTVASLNLYYCEVDRLLNQVVTRYTSMLYTIAIILVVLWFLGMITSYTLSGFIHLLLGIAIIMVLLRVIRGENPLK